jgi:hypothetical protein
VSGLIALSGAIDTARFRWPWRGNEEDLWPRVVVALIGLVVGAVVAGAAHDQLNGAWPALIIGAAAPSVIRRILGQLEVAERKPEEDRNDPSGA